MRFAHHSWTNGNISSPMVWWHQRFATFSWRSKLEEYLQRSLDFIIWLERSFDDLRHHLWVSGTLRWRSWSFSWVWSDVLSPSLCWKDKWYGFGNFSDETLVFVCMETSFKPMSFWNKSKTNNLYKQVFDVFAEISVLFSRSWEESFFGVRRHATRDACAVAHFSSQGSKGAKLGSNKSQSKDKKQAQTLLFPSVRWSKSWNLRETDCVWVEGFF